LLDDAKDNDAQASASDPSRLLGKGVRGDPGRLLREEKTRKRIAKEKPKVRLPRESSREHWRRSIVQLEADLQRIIPEWEAARGTPFLVHGMRYLDSLAAQAGPKRVRPSTASTAEPNLRETYRGNSHDRERPAQASAPRRPVPASALRRHPRRCVRNIQAVPA
jgi:protein regulator of cytokinesis 1